MTRHGRGIAVNDHGGVRVIAFDAPAKRNALSRTMLGQLQVALAGVDHGGHGLVITGGPRLFSAGADLDELAATPSDRQLDEAVDAALRVLAGLAVPSIAAVEGPCVGAAVDIAMACDVVVAAEDAFFEVPALRHGLLYRPTSVARWHRSLPGGSLTRLLLLGERLSAHAARDGGIVDVLTPTGGALPEAVERARVYHGDAAARHTLAMIRALDDGTFDAAEWIDKQHALLGADERRRSSAAWREGRRDTDP